MAGTAIDSDRSRPADTTGNGGQATAFQLFKRAALRSSYPYQHSALKTVCSELLSSGRHLS